MAELLRHRQTKEAATDMFCLTPPRHISTLHDNRCLCEVCGDGILADKYRVDFSMALRLSVARQHRLRVAGEISEFYFRFDFTVAALIRCGMLDMARRIRSEDVAALPAPERLVYLHREIDGPIVFTHGF